MKRDQEALARTTLVKMETDRDRAERTARILRAAADAVDHLPDRIGGRTATRGRWPGWIVRHGARGGQFGRTKIEVSSGPFGVRRCNVDIAMRPTESPSAAEDDVAATMRAVAILLEGGAGAPDADDLATFRMVAALCASPNARPEDLRVMHSGTPFDPPRLHDEVPQGRRDAAPEPDAARAMERLPLLVVVQDSWDAHHVPSLVVQADAERSHGPLDATGRLRLLAELASRPRP